MKELKTQTKNITRCYESYIFNVLLAILIVMAMFISPSVGEIKEFHTYGMKYSFIALLVFGLLEKTKKLRVQCLDGWLTCVILALFAFFNTAGIYLYHIKALPGNINGWLRFFAYSIAYTFVFYRCFAFAENFFKNQLGEINKEFENRIEGIKANSIIKAVIKFCSEHRHLCVSLFILVCWLPWILVYYPAGIEWDTYYPIEQFMGITDRSNHHPWLYVMIVGAFYKFGLKIGSKNMGMFLYILIRDIICASIYGEVVVRLERSKIKKIIPFFVMLFYAITPVFGAYAKHAFKNTLAAALFTLFVMLVIDVLQSFNTKELKVSKCIKLGFSALIFSMILNNGIYITFPVIGIIFLVLLSKKYIKSAIIMMAIMMAFFAWHKVIIDFFEVRPTSKAEALAIPMQQISRTIRDNKDSFDKEDLELLSGYGDLQVVSDAYDPLISDPIKGFWINENHGAKELVNVWKTLLFKYPKAYVEAFIGHTYGYYAFTPREAEHAGNWNCGMTIFGWVKDPRFSPEFTCDYIDVFDKARTNIEKWAMLWDEIPILNLTDTMPLYTWCVVLIGGLMLRRKDYTMLLPVIAMILMILTCMASPVNGCFRYFSAAAAAFPALLIMVGE